MAAYNALVWMLAGAWIAAVIGVGIYAYLLAKCLRGDCGN